MTRMKPRPNPSRPPSPLLPPWVGQASEAERAQRAIATIAGLPRICRVRRCRRARLCVGPAVACLGEHEGLVQARWRIVEERYLQPGATKASEPGVRRAKATRIAAIERIYGLAEDGPHQRRPVRRGKLC